MELPSFPSIRVIADSASSGFVTLASWWWSYADTDLVLQHSNAFYGVRPAPKPSSAREGVLGRANSHPNSIHSSIWVPPSIHHPTRLLVLPCFHSHRINGTSIFTYVRLKFKPNVGKYTVCQSHGSYENWESFRTITRVYRKILAPTGQLSQSKFALTAWYVASAGSKWVKKHVTLGSWAQSMGRTVYLPTNLP